MAPKAGWNVVKFPAAFKTKPVVVALSEYLTGWFTPEKFKAPEIKISIPKVKLPEAPTISLPDVNLQPIPIPTVTIPRISREDWSQKLKDEWEDYVWNNIPSWLIGFRHLATWLAGQIGKLAGLFLNWLWDTMIQRQVDKIQDAVDSALKAMRNNLDDIINRRIIGDPRSPATGSVNWAIDLMRTRLQSTINSGLADTRDKTQEAISTTIDNLESIAKSATAQLTKFSEDALNKAIPKLYEMIGLAQGILLTPVPIANVSETGFAVYALKPGQKIHWIAVAIEMA